MRLRALPRADNSEGGFMEEIERSLVEASQKKYFGIEDFEQLYEQKRLTSQAVKEFQQRNRFWKEDIKRVQQRVCQIQHLADKADRHSTILRSRVEKVNEAHMMGKILMMERMVKLRQEHEQLERKREQCNRVKAEKRSASLWNKERSENNTQRRKQLSFIQSRALKECLVEKNEESLEQKRSKADRIREERSRKQSRVRRYEQFKLEMGKRNYTNKLIHLREILGQKEEKLEKLCQDERVGEKNYNRTAQITKDYLSSIFATETI